MLALVFTMTPTGILAKTKKVVEIKEPYVNAGSYVAMSGSTSEIIYEEHAERKLPMGCITKLMTAMVVIDNMHDDSELANHVDITEKIDAYGDVFKKGESVSVENLLTAMLIADSDEAAEALARYSASTRDIFISEMNSRAIQIGLMSTQFTNPTGAYDDNHYSTAIESAKIMQEAIRYSRIKEILKKDTATITIDGKKKNRTRTFTSTNPLVASSHSNERYKYTKGGILGSLNIPQKYSQYVGVATKNDMQFIVVLLEANDSSIARNAIDLFEYADNKATRNTIIKADKAVGTVRIRGGAKTHLKAYTETKGYAYIPPEGSTDLVQTELALTGGLKAPMKAGDKVGEYRIYVADELKGTVDLVIKKDVKKGWILSNIYISNFTTALVLSIILLLAIIVLRLRAVNKRKARLRARRRNAKIREMAAKQAALDADRKKRNWTYSNYYDSNDINEALEREKK